MVTAKATDEASSNGAEDRNDIVEERKDVDEPSAEEKEPIPSQSIPLGVKTVGIANQSQSREAESTPTTPVFSPSTRASAPHTVLAANSPIRGRKPLRGLILLLVVLLVVSISGVGVYSIAVSQVNDNASAAVATNAATAQMAATQAAINSNLTDVAQANNDTATAQADNDTATAQVATTVAQNPDLYPPNTGNLAFFDMLSQPDQWSEYSDSSSGETCQFTNGAYHINQSPANSVYPCDSSSSYDNFTFEVQMKILKGDCGGIDFRDNGTNGTFYLFTVCQDRTYQLQKYVDYTSANAKPLPTPSPDSSAINIGLNQTNVIAVVADPNTITLFINYQQIASVPENSYTTGSVGLVAYPNNNNDPTEVVYSNARLWT